MPEWTEKMVSQFRKLRSEGLNLTQIADAMGLSKGAVIGKNRRINRPWENMPQPKKTPHALVISPVKTVPRAAGTYRACQFPIGDPRKPSFHFCNAASVPGKPYCADHCAIAYIQVRDRREDAA